MKPNNFDLARLFLAAIVVVFHCGALSQETTLRVLSLIDRHAAVEGFFVISGFLIFASYERSKGLRDYYIKRAKRILPGYWFATLISLVIASCFVHPLHAAKFLAANLSFLTFLQPGIPGVFALNPDNSAINGSLWTIKIEVMFYVAVPVLVWICRKFGNARSLVTTIVFSIAYRYALRNHPSAAVQLPGQLSYFSLGALTYYHLPIFRKFGRWTILPAAAGYCIPFAANSLAMRPFIIAALVLAFSLLLPEVKGPTRWGDFSYGTYVLHYPILQALIAIGLFRFNPWLGVCVGLVCVILASVFSWQIVEKRWLERARGKATIPIQTTSEVQAASA